MSGIPRDALADIEEAERVVICDGCGLERPAGSRCEVCGYEAGEAT